MESPIWSGGVLACWGWRWSLARTLAQLWTAELTPLVANAGLVLTKPPLSSAVALAVTLEPALLLLFSGPVAYKKPSRIIGALAFAVLTVTLIMRPLGDALVLEDPGLTA